MTIRAKRAMRRSRDASLRGPLAIGFAVLLGTSLAGFQQSAYLVTSEPITVHDAPVGLCVAIDPTAPTGIWWWQSGRSGCTSRSTMPGPRQENVRGRAALFHPDSAAIERDSAETIFARFRLRMQFNPNIEVELIARGSRIRCTSTGAEVPTRKLNVLDIPFDPPR